MRKVNAGLKEYNVALKSLNKKLESIGLSIEIRAVGGYAMLYNKLRSGGYTIDVDTVTEDYSEEVNKLISEVSDEEDLEDDWINNDAYELEEVKGIINEIVWIEDKSFSNIKLFVATEKSLLKLKVRAVHFGGLVPRVTDKLDLLDLLGALNIHSVEDLAKYEITNKIETEYPRCYDFLVEQGNW